METSQDQSWWQQPRIITIVVDNDSWILPFAGRLAESIRENGDTASLVRTHDDVPHGVAAFYLGCTKKTPPEVLRRNRFNLVVHESALPEGRGFAPLFWSVLMDAERVETCLIEAEDEVDAGPVYFRKSIHLDGTELNADLRKLQAGVTVDLCLEFLDSAQPPYATPQTGTATFHRRRTPKDSRLDVDRTIRDQFNLLRIVDNERFPAYFEFRGRRYRLAIHDEGPATENPSET